MKRLFAWTAVALLSLFSLQAMAATKILGGPAPGLWWNPNESGRATYPLWRYGESPGS